MPIKKIIPKKTRRSFRRRRNVRRYKARPQRAILEGFPKSKLVKLRYVQTITLNPGAGEIAQKIFRANGAYDPYWTGAGHSPMGYDQWAQIYKSYCVVGSKITMKYVPSANTGTNPGYFGIMLDTTANGTDLYTYTDYLLESKMTGKTAKMAGLIQAVDGKGAYAQATKTFSAKKFFGVNNIQDGKEYSAEIDNTPTNVAYYCCWLGAISGAQDPGESYFEVMIDYIVLFKDPLPIAESGTIGSEPARPGPTGAGQGASPD